MEVKFKFELPEAIWWPDTVGDGIDNDILESLKGGYNFLLFYCEDYVNYTEIISGNYIISGYDKYTKIGDWLVKIVVFGSLNEIKAVAGYYINEVKIISELKTIDPDGLDVSKCFYTILNSKKTINKKIG